MIPGFSSCLSNEKCQTKKSGIFAERGGQFSNPFYEDLKMLDALQSEIHAENKAIQVQD